MTKRLLGIMCVKNEANRYLARCLNWHRSFLDGMFVYDDQSDDNSCQIAWRAGAVVARRPDGVPTFMENEGAFRQAAWESFEGSLKPEEGDVVLAIDADEFVIHASDQNAIRPFLMELDGEQIKVIEVFGHQSGIPQVRIDGYWDDIYGVRVFAYRPNGRFAEKRMGCGSAPTYVQPRPCTSDVALLHYGYAREADQQAKFERYVGVEGHSNAHIKSIRTPRLLRPWEGVRPTGLWEK